MASAIDLPPSTLGRLSRLDRMLWPSGSEMWANRPSIGPSRVTSACTAKPTKAIICTQLQTLWMQLECRVRSAGHQFALRYVMLDDGKGRLVFPQDDMSKSSLP